MADLDENARRRAAGKTVIALSPIAIEVVRRIDALFEIERPINGKSADERRIVRQELSKPRLEELRRYLSEQRAKLSRGHDLAKAIDYILSVGRLSPCSLTTGVSACRTMPPSVRSVALPWGASHGCFADPTAAVGAPPRCTASS